MHGVTEALIRVVVATILYKDLSKINYAHRAKTVSILHDI